MTISGSSQASHLVDQTSSNPRASDIKTASPPNVVGVSPMDRDDPSPVEQVRSVLTTKRNNEELGEKRRGSLCGPPPILVSIRCLPGCGQTTTSLFPYFCS